MRFGRFAIVGLATLGGACNSILGMGDAYQLGGETAAGGMLGTSFGGGLANVGMGGSPGGLVTGAGGLQAMGGMSVSGGAPNTGGMANMGGEPMNGSGGTTVLGVGGAASGTLGGAVSTGGVASGGANTGGSAPTGGSGGAVTLCGINQHVQANACLACGAGTTNAAGDNASGGNTSCDATLCSTNQYVQANACVSCGAGSTNAAGDNATGGNTSCDATLCLANQRVQANACVACGAGTTNAAGDDASGVNTSCDATLCGINQYVQTNACVACGAGTTNAAGDNASGGNTSCGATLCGVNQRVQANACVACGAGTTNAAGDDASGGNTTCDATLCLANQYVQANACLACGAGTTNAAGDNASGGNTSCDVPPSSSCQGLAANCGAGESCCASPTVTGGMFNRDNNASYPATVSSFRLDKYEVTVGRFRNFVAAVVGGWKPASGSGKHTHLNSGAGLANTGGGFEPGWDAINWNTSTNLPTDKATWDGYLSCDAPYQTWTPSSGGNEVKPINCVNWYQSAAFCIWDGGFLPSEAEWNYAAVGGNQQRQYPWSSPASSTTIDCSYANYAGVAGGTDYCVTPGTGATSLVGSVSPKGNGRYGQADLAGNVWEWNLDWYLAPYATTCDNCTNTVVASDRVARGGSLATSASNLLSSRRGWTGPDNHGGGHGLRCARTP